MDHHVSVMFAIGTNRKLHLKRLLSAEDRLWTNSLELSMQIGQELELSLL